MCHLAKQNSNKANFANSEKLSDIIVLDKCEVYSTKRLIKLLHKPKPKPKKGHDSVKKIANDLQFQTCPVFNDA